MTESNQPIGDDDITTTPTAGSTGSPADADATDGSSHGPADAAGSDTDASDGTDGDASDSSSHGPADATGSDTDVTDGTDGDASDSGDADATALAAAVAEIRRRVAADGIVDLAALTALAAAASRRTPGMAMPDMALLGLLDEVDLLVGELGREQASLLGQLRALTRHRVAGSAYGGRSAQS